MKDFATRKHWFEEASPAPQKKWLRWWVLAVVVVGVLIALSLFYQRTSAPAPVATLPVAAPVKKAPPKQAVQFDFYHMLTQEGASTSARPAVKKENANIPAIPSSYVVTLTTYPSRAAAEQHKAQLILSGAPADALMVHQLKENAYQLQAGPFTTQAEAVAAQKALAASAVKSDVQAVK